MRELSLQEVEIVSGSGAIRDTTGQIGSMAGSFIGKSIGSMITIPVLSTLISNITGRVGEQLGQFIGDSLGSLIENLLGITDSSSDEATA
ncbi:hypothetical protein [Erwinia psidii]|uniref:Uncharacterized protein n=1 Tax=Erwinia psidii TaxID=69224 RepID=A0A3N6TWF1_9GAMM|nr:hypothetical protein [Erwinia psidii]MCX8957581.1 hypothetical protein [Erwinia psidii]MCX8960635.1 hypothetical protein [Erwinia psidii]MCX8964120.1 hypothetical protein [Erwinia psidii]RQM39602.1 hypothetical protein EB241_04030 [Erwinia psidii]